MKQPHPSMIYCGLFSALLIPASASGSELTVTVFKDGKPMQDAVVCVGSKQELGLFGSYRTNEQGQVEIPRLPDGKMIITAEDNTAGMQQVIFQNLLKQNVYFRIPAEANEIRCPNEK